MLRLIQTLIALLLGLPLYAVHTVDSIPVPSWELAKAGVEDVGKRNATSKTWVHQDGTLTWSGTIGDIHYKEDYANKAEQWKDIDTSHYTETSEYRLYDRMPFVVKVYKDRTGYEIEGRQDGSKYTIELDEIGGQKIAKHEDNDDLSFRFEISPGGVRLWKELKTNKAPKSYKWKVTEHKKGLLSFREDPETIDRSTKEKAEKLKVTKTPIDATSFYWHEEADRTGVDIDTDVNYSPSSAADDGVRNTNPGELFFTAGWPTFGNASTYQYHNFVRWTSVAVPQGATITNAYVAYTCASSSSGTTVTSNIYLNDADNATSPTNATTYDGKAVTAAVAWNSVGSWTADTAYNTPDISSIVQTVISRAGWASGNALMVLHKDNGSSTNAYRPPYGYGTGGGESTTKASKLYITYYDFVPQILIH